MSGNDDREHATDTRANSSEDPSELEARQTLALEKIAVAVEDWGRQLRAIQESLNRLSNRVGRGSD